MSGGGHRSDPSDGAAGTAEVVELRLRVPARPEELRGVRSAVGAWVRAADAPWVPASDVVLAVEEALANAVDHAYRDGTTGHATVTGERHADGLRVVVDDDGRWRVPAADPGHRGRGLRLIHALADEAEVRPSETGTQVRMVWRAR